MPPRFYADAYTVGDTTIYQVGADPNGVFGAPIGSVAIQSGGTPTVWQNVDGGTTWTRTTAPLTYFVAAGSTFVASQVVLDFADTVTSPGNDCGLLITPTVSGAYLLSVRLAYTSSGTFAGSSPIFNPGSFVVDGTYLGVTDPIGGALTFPLAPSAPPPPPATPITFTPVPTASATYLANVLAGQPITFRFGLALSTGDYALSMVQGAMTAQLVTPG